MVLNWSKKILVVASLLLVSVAVWGEAALALDIGVAPASITERTQTNVTVTITGLTPGESVWLGCWIDANRNGFVEQATDKRLWFLKLTDGVLDPNTNVPGDSDQAANGTISAVLNYHALDVTHAPGQYLYRVVLTSNSNVYDEAPFQITAVGTNQSVWGNVSVNGGGAVPGAYVFLYSPAIDNDIGVSITDTLGNFQVYLRDEFVGQDIVVGAFHPGDAVYSNFNGQSVYPTKVYAGEHKGAVNLKLYQQGAYVISGYVRDAANSAPIPGIWVDAEDLSGNFETSALTNAAGYYELHVPSGTYEVGCWPDAYPLGNVVSRGYVGYDGNWQDVTVATANVSNINFSFSRSDKLFKGKVLDLNSNPVPGYTIEAFNWEAPGEPVAIAVTGSDGSYTLGLRTIGGFPNWKVEGAWSEDNFVNFPYIADQFFIDGSTVSPKNLVVQPHTTWVNGLARNNNLTPAFDEWVYATRPNGSWETGADVMGEGGEFVLPLVAGEWVFGNWPGNGCMSAIFVEKGQTSANITLNVNGNDLGVCDHDLDDDGVLNGTDWWSDGDNCPATPNANQADADGNGIGDACDTADKDGDGLADYLEVRAGTSVSNQDSDSDGLVDGIDSQPLVYQTPLNDNTAFVRQVYLDFLNREPDIGGLTYWVGELNAGRLNRSAVVEQYLLSPEFGEKVAPVTRLYFAYFNRLPDYAGLMYWVNEYASGNRTLYNISDAFAASGEFVSTYGSLDNGQFIDLIYNNLFDRAADPGGKAYWVNELASGNKTRGEVMVLFSDSPEYKVLMANPVYVTMTYIGLLRRSPEQGGFDYWVGRMDQGDSGQVLIGLFLGSTEYSARF